ncbi:hypothetical protein RhiirA4_526138 [Rhizophagus irregularis]|uniref:Uncharacterized protein n=1 Tax=Rhizophagus irregularis TaxID=588596 RepID=A0A2I1GQB0_9GLOM|nr:hypothetical protein RhiirA4_526138 [Rhizophagus irregularis]
MKMYNRIKYKGEMLASEHLMDIFHLNVLQEYDWNTTFKFIKKGTNVNRFVTNALDNEIRTYKINNFIKELPKYEILFKRGNNAIITEACIRCYNRTNNHNVPENWDHMWECTSNEYTEEKIMFNALMELENEFKNNTIKMKPLKHVTVEYITLMNQTSKILISENTGRHALKFRELAKGLYNNQLNKIGRTEAKKEMVKVIWERNYLNIREKILYGYRDVQKL